MVKFEFVWKCQKMGKLDKFDEHLKRGKLENMEMKKMENNYGNKKWEKFNFYGNVNMDKIRFFTEMKKWENLTIWLENANANENENAKNEKYFMQQGDFYFIRFRCIVLYLWTKYTCTVSRAGWEPVCQ